MPKAIVIYYTRSGNTEQMANIITQSMKDAGLETDCMPVGAVKPEDLLKYNAVVIGSPTYYGHMAAPIKQLIDDSVRLHGQLEGKVAAAFTSSANVGGGNETTVMGMIEAMLIHGMVVEGDSKGDHYGPVSVGKPDERATQQCRRKGVKIANLTKKLFP